MPLNIAAPHAHAAASALAVPPAADPRPPEHVAHWVALLERGLIGPPLTLEQRVTRAACEASVRAADRLLYGRSAA